MEAAAPPLLSESARVLATLVWKGAPQRKVAAPSGARHGGAAHLLCASVAATHRTCRQVLRAVVSVPLPHEGKLHHWRPEHAILACVGSRVRFRIGGLAARWHARCRTPAGADAEQFPQRCREPDPAGRRGRLGHRRADSRGVEDRPALPGQGNPHVRGAAGRMRRHHTADALVPAEHRRLALVCGGPIEKQPCLLLPRVDEITRGRQG